MPAGREDAEGDAVDHLEAGPPSPGQARRMLLVTALVLVAALVAVVALSRPDGSAAPEPAPTTPGRPSPSVRPTPSRAPSPSGTADRYAPVRDSLGAPVLPAADPGWELFLEGAQEVFRVQLATGDFVRTRTRTPAGDSYPSAVVAGPEGLLTYSGPSATAQLVPDDGPARDVRLPGADAAESYIQVYPGPAGDLWTAVQDPDGTTVLSRVDTGGRVTEGPRTVPAAGSLSADGRGGLLLTAPGGVWELVGDGARRLAHGSAAGVGPRVLVLVVCDDELACEQQALDRDTGEVRALGPADVHDAGFGVTGTTSPDGSWWARWTFPAEGARLEVVDLRTGATVLEHHLDATGLGDPLSSMAWTPDGGLLLLVTGQGLVSADPRTGELTSLDAPSDELHRLAVRG